MPSVQQLASHHWRVPMAPFVLQTADGVRIEGSRLDGPDEAVPALVLCHGLMGWHRKPRFAAFAERLTAWFTIYAPDLRGHGASGGVCDFGGDEVLDVDAVVRRAHEDGHDSVVTAGASMGGIAVIRHGALLGGTDQVVAISSLAYWDWHGGADPGAQRAFQARVGTAAGRAALRAVGVRLPDDWEPPESPEEVIGKLAPVPVVIVHGRNDHLFSLDHAERLYEAAGEPRHLMIGDRFGHAEDGLTSGFARRLSKVIYDGAELPWSE